MIETEQIEIELEEQLERVKQEIVLLDLLTEKLLQIEKLAHKVIEEDLDQKEVQFINNQAQKLEEQATLLAIQSGILS